MLLPVDDHGPQAQVDEVAAGASQDEHGHVAFYLASPVEQTGRQGHQDEDVQEEARYQEHNFGGGAEVQIAGDVARGGGRLVHGRPGGEGDSVGEGRGDE